MWHHIEVGEYAKILLQSLTDSYDQLIINLTNRLESLVFNDVAIVILEGKIRHKNKKDRLTSSHQVEALTIKYGC